MAKGSNLFQDIIISLSYRKRGYLARSHTQKNIKKIAFMNTCHLPSEILVKYLVNVAKIVIIPYSAKNKIVNPTEEYSVLNPETNSDSLSEKSNGVRLVSATLTIIHKITLGVAKKKVKKKTLFFISQKRFIPETKIINLRITTERQIS